MGTRAQGTIEITGWDEQPYLEIDGERKLTRAEVSQRFHGAIEGEGSITWLMAYRADGTADFLGFQRIVGAIDGAHGSIVLRSEGTFDGKVAGGTWVVVEGAGTGDLAGVTGGGTSTAPFGGTPTYDLTYE